MMRITALCAALGFVCTTLLGASEWPRYRGPNGSGISEDRLLPRELGPDRHVLWKTAVSHGNSSPVIVRDRVFITGHDGDQRGLFCYDAASGSLLWRQAVTKARTETPNPLNGPTTPSPATDGRSVFVFYPEFGLLAYDLDGREQWRVPLGPFGHIQGMAVSPIHVEANVVLLVDTPEQAYLAAFDARTGRQAWKVDRPIGFLGSYATPSLYQPANGPTQIVVAGAVELTGYEAKTGERRWWARGVTFAPAALPLVAGDSVYTVEPVGEAAPSFSQMLSQFDKNKDGRIQLTEVEGEGVNQQIMYRLFKAIDTHAGDGDGVLTEEEFNRSFSPEQSAGGLVRVRLNGQGDVSTTHVQWRHTRGLPYVTAPLLYENILYVIRNGGILTTFHPETGKVLREARLKDALGEYYASPVAADGKIYFVSKEGKITVIKAGQDWEVLSTGDLDEQVIATPAIAGGRIFVRTQEHLYSFGLETRAKSVD
jgi:outer membrane protein assembly factor BamB